MNNVKSEMIDIYKLGKYDWMNYKINEEDVITFHHIIKVEDGGEYIKENGALLTERAHEYLHYIERVDKKIYQSILLDENTGSHLALGNAYLYGIEEIDKINKSLYHIDLVFGTDDLLCKAFTENNKEIIIIKDGKLVYGI